MISIPQAPLQQVYHEVYKRPVTIPQAPIMQTSYQRVQQPVYIPQPPVIQKQTRVYDQGSYLTNQNQMVPSMYNSSMPQGMAQFPQLMQQPMMQQQMPGMNPYYH